MDILEKTAMKGKIKDNIDLYFRNLFNRDVMEQSFVVKYKDEFYYEALSHIYLRLNGKLKEIGFEEYTYYFDYENKKNKNDRNSIHLRLDENHKLIIKVDDEEIFKDIYNQESLFITNDKVFLFLKEFNDLMKAIVNDIKERHDIFMEFKNRYLEKAETENQEPN